MKFRIDGFRAVDQTFVVSKYASSRQINGSVDMQVKISIGDLHSTTDVQRFLLPTKEHG